MAVPVHGPVQLMLVETTLTFGKQGVDTFVTFRILLLERSIIYILQEPSTETAIGKFSLAPVATPPSPENPAVPVPAMVLIMPVEASTFRILLLPVSTIYTLP